MEKSHDYYLKETIKMAVENVSSGNGGPFGAIVVRNGEIIGKGVNTVTGSNDPTAHAEVNAIRDACRNIGDFQLNGCVIYSSCEPCPMCMGAIYWARPDKVYFAAGKSDAAQAGFDDSFIYSEIEKIPENRNIPFILLRMSESLVPFAAWENTVDKKEY